MRHRIVRPVVLTLLILIGIASAGVLWFGGQRLASLQTNTTLAATRVDALITGMTDLDAALQAYVAPGQSVSTWTARATALTAQLTDDLGAFERLPASAGAVEAVRPALAALAKIDGRVQEYLKSGDDLMAADLAFNEARDTTAAAVTALRDWRAARESAAASTLSRTETVQTAALGAMLLAWAATLVLAWKRPADATAASVTAEAATTPAFAAPAPVTASESLAVDLQAAAAAADAFARAADGAALKAALGRSAAALGAKGVVVWLGVGDQLFAVASHGYDERHLKRPIAKGAENVTAETWRTGEAVAIAGEGDAPGVLVVPMADAAGCRGVVSAELLPGQPVAADRQALLAMFAAQLGGLVAAPAQAPATAPVQAEAVPSAPAPDAPVTAFDELDAVLGERPAAERAS